MAANIGVNLTMKISSGANGSVKLRQMKKEAENTKSLINKAVIILEQSHLKTFEQEGRPSKWKKSKRAAAQSGQTLQDEGRLRQSVTAKSPHAIRQVGNKSLTFGTKLIYAPSHQFGYAKRGIPKRPFLGVFDEDIKKFQEVFKDDIEGRLKVIASE